MNGALRYRIKITSRFVEEEQRRVLQQCAESRLADTRRPHNANRLALVEPHRNRVENELIVVSKGHVLQLYDLGSTEQPLGKRVIGEFRRPLQNGVDPVQIWKNRVNRVVHAHQTYDR